ncbi:MAG TPA: hypothetical protein VGQ03_11180 [Nitrososphaera sp.]|jgi:hypothetical protein|nr:hypothetical protein [Nitrososphaera sp.]
MRLPLKGTGHACDRLNPVIEDIQLAYLEAIDPAIKLQSVNAMLGDGTITQTNTFDPANVRKFYQRVAKSLGENGWSNSEVASSETEDLHRLFFQVSKDLEKYHLTGYFGVQFHALPYYKVDKRVMEIQKELSRIADEAGAVFGEMSGAADKALRLELEKKGYADLEFQELFTKMFDDENLVKELDNKASAVERNYPKFEEIRKRKGVLFGELNDLLMYLYQTSPVVIDHNRQMQGEEGVTTYFDLEVIKNKKTKIRDAFIDPANVTAEWADKLAEELEAIVLILRKST